MWQQSRWHVNVNNKTLEHLLLILEYIFRHEPTSER
jgi:hypothetical protein